MTSKQEKILGAVAGISLGLQLAVRIAHKTGRLSDGQLYWTLILALSITTFGAVLWIYAGRRSR